MSAGRGDIPVALVSGVARPPGIGRAAALRLAARGYALVVADLVSPAPSDTGHVSSEAFDGVVAELRATLPPDAAGSGQRRVEMSYIGG